MDEHQPKNEKCPVTESGGAEEWSALELVRKFLEETWFLVLVFLVLGFVYTFAMAWKWYQL